MLCKEQITRTEDGLLIRAPAKINLTLLISGKRADGFHEIETVMAKIDFFDEILVQNSRTPGIKLFCRGPYWAPDGEKNIIYSACKELLQAGNSTAGVKITLTKNIPAGSGLGSASSDAAATLIAVNKLLELGLDENKLHRIASKLGSDVPFFLNGPLAFCTGKGEKIKKLNKNFPFAALLILPNVTVSTKRVYENYTHDSRVYERLKPVIDGYIEKNRIDLAAKMCANMLQPVCFRLHKELIALKSEIESLGCRPLCLSGSGSAMFRLVDRKELVRLGKHRNQIAQKLGCKSVIVNDNRW